MLRRVINLRLRGPSYFQNPNISPAGIPTTAEKRVDLRFFIPGTIRVTDFPMEVYITTVDLSPYLDSQIDDGLTLDYQVPGKYRYKYIVRSPGQHTVHFKTVSNTTSPGTLLLESELFHNITINLADGNLIL